ncbi:hypothetical protein [Sphingomonas echinoides]|uniref:hypothetical protein n=1 Tax=Sphingomonas echinoides TaxID=59803 RepID=UPI0024135030|nr:hypothetical protein [Sphingomonas echinoides]
MASLLPEITNETATPIAWAGGDCPVPANTLVQVQCVFETEFDHTQPPRKASAWARRWNRDYGDECGITHYVIVADAGGAA